MFLSKWRHKTLNIIEQLDYIYMAQSPEQTERSIVLHLNGVSLTWDACCIYIFIWQSTFDIPIPQSNLRASKKIAARRNKTALGLIIDNTKKIKMKRLCLRLWGPSEIHIPLFGSPRLGPMYRLNRPLIDPGQPYNLFGISLLSFCIYWCTVQIL